MKNTLKSFSGEGGERTSFAINMIHSKANITTATKTLVTYLLSNVDTSLTKMK